MKKKFLVLVGMLMMSGTVFANPLDKTIISYEPMVAAVVLTNGTESGSSAGYNFFGIHAGLIWDKLSVNLGFKGLFGNIEADVGYNVINNDYVVWSAGGRIALDSYVCPGFGLSTNVDGLIPITQKVHFDIGLGLGFCWYPTLAMTAGKASGQDLSGYTCFTLELTPRVGVSIKQ